MNDYCEISLFLKIKVRCEVINNLLFLSIYIFGFLGDNTNYFTIQQDNRMKIQFEIHK